jgi:putative transposase
LTGTASSVTKLCANGRTKFGQQVANRIRRRLERIAAKWYLDEVVLKISGVKHWLWRAVDQAGNSLYVLVQIRRDATKRELRKLLKKQMRPPRVMIAGKPARYGAAKRKVVHGPVYRQHKGLNNRAENSHQPTRRQERQIKGFKSTGQAQRFLFAHDQIDNLLHVRCPDIFPVDLIQLTRPDKVTVPYGTAKRWPWRSTSRWARARPCHFGQYRLRQES